MMNRLSYSVAQEGHFPQVLSMAQHKRVTPVVSLIVVVSTNFPQITDFCRGVVEVSVEWSNHLTGDAKVMGSIPGTALTSLSKAFYLHYFSPPRC